MTRTFSIGALSTSLLLWSATLTYCQEQNQIRTQPQPQSQPQQNQGRPQNPRDTINPQSANNQTSQQQQQQQRGATPRQGSNSQQQNWYSVRPIWMRVGYDTNGDGMFEAVEYIYGYDLDKARRSSRRREMAAQTNQFERVTGTVSHLKTVTLNGTSHAIAKVATEQGRTAKVALGPQQQLTQLNLQDGAQVTIFGKRGRINDRTMLIAHHVHTDTNSVDIEHELMDRQFQIRGTIRNLRNVNFQNVQGDREYLVAEVQTQTGQPNRVILGPKAQLQQFNFQNGDQFRAVVCQARMNDQQFLLATSVSANGQSVQIDPKLDKEKTELLRSQAQSRQHRINQNPGSDQNEGRGQINNRNTTIPNPGRTGN